MSRLRIVSMTYYLDLPEEVMEKYEYVFEDVVKRSGKEQYIQVNRCSNHLQPNTLILTCNHRYLTDEDAAYVIRLINTSEQYKCPH